MSNHSFLDWVEGIAREDSATHRRLRSELERFADDGAGDGWQMLEEDQSGETVAVLALQDTDQFADVLAIGVAVVGDGFVGLSGIAYDDDTFRAMKSEGGPYTTVQEAVWAAKIGMSNALYRVIQGPLRSGLPEWAR